jgi:hypothetical protein
MQNHGLSVLCYECNRYRIRTLLHEKPAIYLTTRSITWYGVDRITSDQRNLRLGANSMMTQHDVIDLLI